MGRGHSQQKRSILAETLMLEVVVLKQRFIFHSPRDLQHIPTK